MILFRLLWDWFKVKIFIYFLFDVVFGIVGCVDYSFL